MSALKKKTKTTKKAPPLKAAVQFPETFNEVDHGEGDIFVRVADVTKGRSLNKGYRPEMVRIVDGVVAERKFVGDANLVAYAFSRAMELVDPRANGK